MNIKQWIAMSMALGCSTAVFASTTDVIVTGVIKPAACTPSLSGGGTFDFGVISATELKQDDVTHFISPIQQLAVSCDAPTRFALRGVDGRAGTSLWSASKSRFGLGTNDLGQKIGGYLLQTLASTYVADGISPVTRLVTANNGTSWGPDSNSSFSYLYNGAEGHFHGFSVGADVPSAIKQLTADLQIDMSIAPLKDLTVNDDITIDGASTIEVSYL
ncbi:DUF1120 domain-containing protein [Pseudomonas sp. NPDC089428]|uniref:DUF1120 domain-containing protein n=1 Tax=Pseudomonas sp. NPDC089428 TaxID=3364467 RepID=UPI003829B205